MRGHKFLTEKAVFAKWAAMYGIVFHEPSWSGHMKGVDGNTVVDTLFKRRFREYELKKLDEANNGTTPNHTLKSWRKERVYEIVSHGYATSLNWETKVIVILQCWYDIDRQCVSPSWRWSHFHDRNERGVSLSPKLDKRGPGVGKMAPLKGHRPACEEVI